VIADSSPEPDRNVAPVAERAITGHTGRQPTMNNF
jgi:hypothetical protein